MGVTFFLGGGWGDCNVGFSASELITNNQTFVSNDFPGHEAKAVKWILLPPPTIPKNDFFSEKNWTRNFKEKQKHCTMEVRKTGENGHIKASPHSKIQGNLVATEGRF